MGDHTLSDIHITRADVARVQAIAYDKRDEWEGDEEAVSAANILIEFCEVLLGRETVDSFLSGQDMDS